MVFVPPEEKSDKTSPPLDRETNPDYGDQPPPAYDLVVSEFPADIAGPSSRSSPPQLASSSSPPPPSLSSPAWSAPPTHPYRSGSNHNRAASIPVAIDNPALKYAPPTANADKSLPLDPSDNLSPKAGTLRSSKSNSWLSMFMPSSNKNTKQVRTTVLNLVRGLVIPNGPELSSIEDVLARAREMCSSYDLNLSTILQEYSIESHTPIYWAIVSPRREQLLAPLVRCASPLNPQSLSDIRRACLAVSDQPLYHAFRMRRYPFNSMSFTDPSSVLNTADALVLGDLNSDDVQVEELEGDGAFIASFDIALWQKRLRVAGKVSIQFIARGRLWQITFFSSVPPQSTTTAGKSVRKLSGSWYASLSLLEHSPPTHIDSLLVIDVPRPSSDSSMPPTTAQQNFSPPTILVASEGQNGGRPQDSNSYSSLAHNASLNPGISLTTRELTSSLRNGTLAGTSLSPYFALPTPGPSPSGSHVSLVASQHGELLPPSPPLSTPSPTVSPRLLDQNTPFDKVTAKAGGALIYRLTAFESQLARKAKGGKGQDGDADPKETSAKNVAKSETWSEKDVHYINRLVVPLCEGPGSSLMYDDSSFLSADGTLRGRLEARLVKATEESTKDCIIC